MEIYQDKLYALADSIRAREKGDVVYLRGIIEFSNYCRRNCLYCGLRRDNTKLGRYRMSPEEIIKRAKEVAALGIKTVVLQSGEDPYYKLKDLVGIVSRIKELGVYVTLSIGELSTHAYRELKKAGADRYLLRHETANRKLYEVLHPDGSFFNRVRCLYALKDLGYEVGAGNMVGLPGQTDDMLWEDLLFMEKLQPEMVGIGPFIPHPDTPLAKEKGGTLEQTLTMIALTRIILPKANIPATTALGTIHPEGRELGLKVGANVVMPNMTPQPYRPLYQLYPGKICVNEDPDACLPCLKRRIESIGRTII
ncbi:[FeFe] hydrogenase H-cluster radical SAM maturase HydE [Carboxydothermus hydrogenoformans]|uniref:Radical SAM domain protein n=1 Tax=Carboxydothermus hydrogenoformans (strain ATCC BAA-161 / DSM 6008 / Z-2901) TaxID=246194 RepID=Q3A9E2_CARHZ|nr:[FeFe] hydrogenase H-cluster radical SAM maturase HydE [Carboxydothermus hydrogenoformans]ABB16006.1 radical SAM domain protein [Carboxydothermus hydrogenoformans Z-2901]